MKIVMDNEDNKKKNIIYKDVLGLGRMAYHICELLIVVAIALTCAGSWGDFFSIFK